MRRKDTYPAQGKWAVGLLDHVKHFYTRYDEYHDAISTMAVLGQLHGGVVPSGYPRTSGEPLILETGANASGTNWIVFRDAITNQNVRNVYYFGHGAPDYIGDTYNGLGSLYLSILLNNQAASTNNHRFRFVWLDGCETASAKWANAFGLGTRENVPLSDYTVRPGVFMGSVNKFVIASAIVDGAGNVVAGSCKQDMYLFRSEFAFWWGINGQPVSEAITSAKRFSNWSEFQYLKLWGYGNMHVDEFNQKFDWP